MKQTLLFSLLLSLVLPCEMHAQPPATISIQGRLESSAGGALQGTRNWRVRFFDSITGGFQVGTDITGSVTIGPSGRFNLEVQPPAALLTSTQPCYELAVDSAAVPDGVGSEDVFPDRVKINSVPFALKASDSLTVGGLAPSSFVTQGNVTLNNAYNGAGSGAGRTITAASGDVAITGAGGITSQARIESGTSVNVATGAGPTVLKAQMTQTVDGGKIELFDEAGVRVANLGAATGGVGGTAAFRMANANNVGVGIVGDGNQANGGGQISLFNSTQGFAAQLSVGSGGGGIIDTYPPAGGVPVSTMGSNSQNGGYIEITDSAGNSRAALTQLVSGEGAFAAWDATNTLGVLISPTGKSFVAADPDKAGRLIRYYCLEGPEAGMYARGKAVLHDGTATIELPSHFSSLADPESITVTLTPRSADSKGLAAVEVTGTTVRIKELLDGKGNYEVDWTVWGERTALKNAPVYIEENEFPLARQTAANRLKPESALQAVGASQ